MAKVNSWLARQQAMAEIRATAKAEMHRRFALQQSQDMAVIALHEAFGFGADSYDEKTFCSRKCYHKFITLRVRRPKEAQKMIADAKKKKQPKIDCAAYDAEKHDCKALIALFCEYGDCSFYCGKGRCNNATD